MTSPCCDTSDLRERPPKALVGFGPLLARGLFRPLLGGPKAAAAEDLEREGNGTERADQEERPADGPALVGGEAVRQQEADAGAKQRSRPGDQAELRKSN